MRDLNYISSFAFDTHFGLTSPLTHSEVKILAQTWLPHMTSHEKDLYHPIGLTQFLDQAKNYTDTRPDLWIETIDANQTINVQPPVIFPTHAVDLFDPPSHNMVIAIDNNYISSSSYITCLKNKIASSDIDAIAADPFIVLSGLRYLHSKEIYGSTTSRNGYQIPRLPMVIIAEFRMLRETLKHNILAYRNPAFPKDGNKLLDAIRSDFIVGINDDELDLLLKLIEYSEKGDRDRENELLEKLQTLRLGFPVITQKQWHTIRDFGFLEYYFMYAYNDTKYYPELGHISNEHEGDIEGCCLAFRREVIEGVNKYRDQAERRRYLASSITPYCLMTAAHEEYMGLDGIRVFDRRQSADSIQDSLCIWIALGSHATYLDGAGDHGIDATTDAVEDFINDNDLLAAACVILTPICTAVLLIAAIIDHFNDATDKTSDNGVYTGSPGHTVPQDPQQDARFVPASVETTPLSVERNIYSAGAFQPGDATCTLAQRSFPGKWGCHNGCLDDSPPFNNKTSRFFNLLLKKGDV